MDREEAKNLVKGYLGDYLRSSRGIKADGAKTFRCLNPEHEDKHPSMGYDKKHQKVHCFACGAKYDIFDLIKMDYGLSDHKAIFDKAYELYNIEIDKKDGSNKKESNNQRMERYEKIAQKMQERSQEEKKAPGTEATATGSQEKAANSLIEYFRETKARRSGSPAQAYLTKRGISEEVAERFWLGYDSEYIVTEIGADGNGHYSPWQVLIIPTSENSLTARNINEVAYNPDKNRIRKKGASVLFNGKVLYSSSKPIFITEGEIDALSIIEVGGEAVGLGSVENYKILINTIRAQRPVQPLILCLDQDDAGRTGEEKLAKELEALGVPFYRRNISGAAKDPNAALVADREIFAEEVAAAERIQEEEKAATEEAIKEAYLNTSAAATLQDFLQGINESVNTPVINTGFYKLNEVIDGGLYEGLYILGAMSSLGKTTFALQLADNLAKQGQDVLIFSLEMSKHELVAKSISRLTYIADADKRKKNAKTTRGITAGARYKNYNKTEMGLINRALATYKDYAQHIFIHEGMGDIGVEKVKEVTERHISITGCKPVVIIDYLQILAPHDVRASDKQNTDKAVLELKRMSRDNKITVIAISSFNRESYKGDGGANKGKVLMTDFKESGAIEYSADVLLGLEFQEAGGKDYNEKTEKRKDPRQIRLVILKNRNGKAWESAEFKYYSMFNYFEESITFEPTEENAGDIFADLRGKTAN